MFTPRTRTLRGALALALAKAVVLTAGFGGSLAAATALTQSDAVLLSPEVPSVTESIEDGRPLAPHSPRALWAEHGETCWTREMEPKAKIPGAAIVQDSSGFTVYTTERSVVSKAFEEALSLAGYGDFDAPNLEVIALCV